MDMLRRLLLIAGWAFVILSAACSDAPEQRDPPIEDRAAERPEREDPALTERRRLAGELASLENQHASLTKSLHEQQNEVGRSERELRQLRRSLERQKAQTNH